MAGETRSIDLAFIGRTGKSSPRALFIPTATRDSEEYIQQFELAYRKNGCEVDTLRLWTPADVRNANAKISASDLIYVGGGNTKEMLEKWREFGVDRMLFEASKRGAVLGGTSAGAICWFRMGNSDWPQYEGIPGLMTAPLDCLGFVDLVLCPHCSREPFRLGDFRQMMCQVGGIGIGLDDGCAIQIEDDTYRILSSIPGAVAHRIVSDSTGLSEDILEPHEGFRPLDAIGIMSE
jgi:dipeptidase E